MNSNFKKPARLPCRVFVAMVLLANSACDRNPESHSPTNQVIDTAVFHLASSPETSAKTDTGWPCLYGPDQTCISREQIRTNWNECPPAKKWQNEIGVGYSSPVAANGAVVIHHRQDELEIVESFDAEDGSSQWRTTNSTAFKCKFEYSNGPYSTPILTADSVLSVGAESVMQRLNRNDGSVIWKRELGVDYNIAPQLFGFGTTPLLQDDRVYLNLGAVKDEAGIAAFDFATGQTLWTSTSYESSYSTPVRTTVDGVELLLVLTKQGLVCLSPADGKELWFFKFEPRKIDSINACLPVVTGDTVFLTAGPGHGCVLLKFNAQGHDLIWRQRRSLDSQFNPVIRIADRLFGFPSMWNGSAYFRCLNLSDGKVRWSWKSEKINRGTSLSVADHFILLGEYGHLGLLKDDKEAPTPVYVSPEPILQPRCFSSPALANGLLFLRNEQHVVCLDLRETTD